WTIGLALIFGLPQLWLHMQTKEVSYSRFKYMLREGRVLEVQMNKEKIKGILYVGRIDGLQPLKSKIQKLMQEKAEARGLSEEKQPSLEELLSRFRRLAQQKSDLTIFQSVRVEDPKLIGDLDASGVDYSGVQKSMVGQVLWGTVLPIIFWVGLWFLLFRGMGRPGAGLLSIGKSKAKISVEKDTGVRFEDVAGCEESKEELKEVVEFLKNPKKYEDLGAKIPKGVLLLGPPGTGKTLLSRALAGEAKVPFYSISGSEFIEMFVGVGAARVRDLFTQAKKNTPCIIFVDEIDAIGKFRGGGMVGGGNEEREQTLNQLLVEMDGFEPNLGVILLAATNRPEVLDPALLRPGRFDRQIILDAPDVRGREAILKVHSRDKPLASDIDLKSIALRTQGFSGADLANIMNEAALLAARHGLKEITQAYLEDAVEKVFAGPERKSRRLGKNERRRVAYHESGHALVAFHCPNASPVAKISIIPRGKAALGYTLQLPEEERFLMTKSELIDKICVSLGGRAAEKIILGEVSSGAQNDLEVATEIAKSMICRFGMNEEIGPMVLSRETNPFLRGPGAPQSTEPMSPELASQVDKEVRQLLNEQSARAQKIIEEHQESLKRIADRLLVEEIMSEEEFRKLAGKAEGEEQNAIKE
ncbi:MAG: ATP-dependent zinc metalloprotease FtsH, partial [Nitrospiraceae bacterium]|nr:ATP-dependent zinc metalloprotease FtsH [Nitrospiraceae bacterium]